MEKASILKENIRFAGYTTGCKLSRNHDGVREVYLAYDADDRQVVLTVFDLRAARYASDGNTRRQLPVLVDEVRFHKGYASDSDGHLTDGLPEYLGCGIETYNRHRYGWMAQEYVQGTSLDEEIRLRGSLPTTDALEIARKVAAAVEAAARFTRGGGHYNISTDNIIVRYDGDTLADVRLIGFGNMGEACSGNSPVSYESLDSRFRAPEMQKGIFCNRSDIYSLGMVVVLMLFGYPEGSTSSMDFHDALWEHAEESIHNTGRLILHKATNASPSSRFASMEKFCEFLAKLQPRQFKVVSKTCAMPQTAKDPKGSLDDVAGMAELKSLFRRDFIRIVRNPDVAGAYGIKPSNCTLLYGPQGCGKTFIAEKAAQESGLKYKIVNPSELGSIYVHGSQQKIAELFEEAEKSGPMILIFDEFDAMVPRRDEDLNTNQANEVNEMLTRLNNCASRGVYVLATSNRPGLIDPAIMRKGRVDRVVYVSMPDAEARTELFRLEIEKRPHEGIDYPALATATDRYTCSDISFIVEETARLCFEETLDSGLKDPLPLTMERLLDVIAKTGSSVSDDQQKEYLELKQRMESRNRDERKKVGFAV